VPKGNKSPKARAIAVEAAKRATERRPRKLANLGITGGERRPSWRLALVDLDGAEGSWGWRSVLTAHAYEIFSFLREMEKLSWTEIMQQMTGGRRRRGQKHKFIPQSNCCERAQNRLIALELDDYRDDWFRFRTTGKRRLWGIIDEDVFYPVWWDTEHEVCPSHDPD
jgi:hypothetical protein